MQVLKYIGHILRQVYAFAKAKGYLAKTDKLDALLLEQYAGFVAHREKGDKILSDIHKKR